MTAIRFSWGFGCARIRTSSIHLHLYSRTIIARYYLSGKSGDQLIHLCAGIVKVRSNTQTVTTWCCQNVSLLEMGIELHRAQVTPVPNTNYLRLLPGQTRTHNIVIPQFEIFAEIIGQLLKISGYRLNAYASDKRQTGLQTMDQRRWTCPGFPDKSATIPLLVEVAVIVWIGNTDPAHQGGSDSCASALGKIQEANSLRR